MVPEKFRNQVTFFNNLEAKTQDILDLEAKGDHLGRLAYGQDVFNAIYNSLSVSISGSLQYLGISTPGRS